LFETKRVELPLQFESSLLGGLRAPHEVSVPGLRARPPGLERVEDLEFSQIARARGAVGGGRDPRDGRLARLEREKCVEALLRDVDSGREGARSCHQRLRRDAGLAGLEASR
jgi:hypothetical protein